MHRRHPYASPIKRKTIVKLAIPSVGFKPGSLLCGYGRTRHQKSRFKENMKQG